MAVAQLSFMILGASFIGLANTPASAQPVEVIEDEPEKANAAVPRAVGELPPESFDCFVFRDLNSSALREKLDGWLSSRLTEIDVQCQLTQAQREKLKLAGRMEINQVMERIASQRREFELVRHDWEAGNRFLQGLDPLHFALTNRKAMFREQSLLDKVAQATLTSEQLSKYHERLERDRREHRLRLQTKLLQNWEKQIGPLTEEQRRHLLTLLEEFPLKTPGPQDTNLMWEIAAEIPSAKYREILDKRQWDSLYSVLERSRQFQRERARMAKLGGF